MALMMPIKQEQMDNSSSSSYFSSDEEPTVGFKGYMPAPTRTIVGEKFTLRGPGIIGGEEFDDHCIFANKMLIDRFHIISIKNTIKTWPAQTIKYYIYKLNPSTVNQSSKMEFGEKFTKAYLKRYLPTSNEAIEVTVSSSETESRYPVWMKLGRGKEKKAIITTGWKKIVEDFQLKADEVLCFDFWECKERELHLTIEHI